MNPNQDNIGSWESAGLPNPELPRDKIKFIKQQVAQSTGGLSESTKRLQKPFSRHLAQAHPKTRVYIESEAFLKLRLHAAEADGLFRSE